MQRPRPASTLPARLGGILLSALSACNDEVATTGGAEDVGSCPAMLARGQLVITEVMPDPAGADDDSFEWFEVHNPTAAALPLHGLGLEYSKIDGRSPKGHLITDEALTIEAGAYMVFGKAAQDTRPEHVDYGYAVDIGNMGNSEGKLRIVCGEVTIDEVLYEDPRDGYSRSFGSRPLDAIANDDLGKWCLGSEVYRPKEYGSPGAENPDCPLPIPPCGQCYEGEVLRPARAPSPGQLVITEVMANASTRTDAEVGEWFEVYAAADVDLNCLQFGGNTSRFLMDPSNAERVLTAARCLSVSAGSYSMFTEHVSWPGADFESKISLVDTPSTSNPNPGVYIAYDGEILDEVHYKKAKDGVAWSLDPDALTAADNDDPVNWCDASGGFAGGDLGSPGGPNPQCPVIAKPGTCIDDGGSPRDIDYAAKGELLITEFLADPKLGDGTLGEWIELRVGADLDLNGLTLGKTLDGSYATVSDIACLPVAAGSHVLLAKSGDEAVNGGLPAPDYINTHIALTNDGSTLVIGVEDQRNMTHVELDAVNWGNTADGKARQLPLALLPVAIPFDVTINDDSTLWCDATAPFGAGDLGTPRTGNLACDPIPSGDECTDPITMMLRKVVHPVPGDLLITEIHPDPDALIKSGGAGEPAGEWFELHAASTFDLNGIELGNVFPTKKHTVTSALCLSVAAGSHVLLASAGQPLDPPNPGDIGGNGGLPAPDYEYKGLSLSNTGSSLYVGLGGVELDRISNYPKPSPGEAIQLGTAAACISPAPLDTACNDDFAQWCAAVTTYGLGDSGTPGAPNSECGGDMAATCFDQALQAMRPIVAPVPGDLIINEFMADPTIVTDANGEWFEVQALNAVDLNDLKILNKANADMTALAAAKPLLVSANCLHAEAGSFILFAHSADPNINGNLPPVGHVVSTTLSNASGGVSLALGDALLHTVGWTKTQKPGKSTLLDPEGIADPMNINADGLPWCVAVDDGTPGQENPQCP